MLQKELSYEFQNILYNDLRGKLTICYLYVLDSHTTPGTATPLQANEVIPIQCTGMYICHICVHYRTLRRRGHSRSRPHRSNAQVCVVVYICVHYRTLRRQGHSRSRPHRSNAQVCVVVYICHICVHYRTLRRRGHSRSRPHRSNAQLSMDDITGAI